MKEQRKPEVPTWNREELAEELVSVGDIATRSGQANATVRQWAIRGTNNFPSPVARTAAGDIYLWSEVGLWLRVTRRMKAPPAPVPHKDHNARHSSGAIQLRSPEVPLIQHQKGDRGEDA